MVKEKTHCILSACHLLSLLFKIKSKLRHILSISKYELLRVSVIHKSNEDQAIVKIVLVEDGFMVKVM